MNKVTKKRTLLIIATLFAATLGGAVLAGCANRGGITVDDVTEGGYTCAVTFDTAGGAWASGSQNTSSETDGEEGETEKDEESRMEVRQMYVKPGSLLNKEKAEEFAKTVREGYTFNTFYTGTKDGNGNVTYGERWDYSKPVTESVTLYARWMENYSLVAHYGENFSQEKTFTVPQNSEGVAQSITSMNFTSEGVTVIAMYENKDKTGEFTVSNVSPYTAPCTPEHRVHHVYVETLDGTWTVVRSRRDFNIYTASWLYLLTDVDCAGEVIDIPTEFTGKIYGNNHTVKNFKVEQTPKDRNDRYFGLFKQIQDNVDGDGNFVSAAEIKDITFEGVQFKAILNNPQVREYNAGVFAGRVTNNTVIRNVTVKGTFQFAITNKGRDADSNHYEDTQVDWAIGYRLTDDAGNEIMDKYEVNIEGATVVKYEAETLGKDELGNPILPEIAPSTGDEENGGADGGSGSDE